VHNARRAFEYILMPVKAGGIEPEEKNDGEERFVCGNVGSGADIRCVAFGLYDHEGGSKSRCVISIVNAGG
jgi:hypothetical protein